MILLYSKVDTGREERVRRETKEVEGVRRILYRRGKTRRERGGEEEE